VGQRNRLLQRLRQERRLELPPIPRRGDRQAPAALSFAQERLWLLDRLRPGDAAYNIAMAVRITGHLDVKLLRLALDTLCERHETLRTTFAVVAGQAVQVVAHDVASRLWVVDLSGLSADGAAAEMQRLHGEEARRGFDLEEGPLLRATLAVLSPTVHVLLLNQHHIISDLWSLGVLIRELTQVYRALQEGSDAGLGELPIQYADYAVWQREQLPDERLEEEIARWARELEQAPVSLELATDRPRPPVFAGRGARLPLELTAAGLAPAMRTVCHAREATPFMVLVTAYGVLLGRYSAQQDLLIGAPVANRTRTAFEGLIGFFVNLLVVRVSWSGGTTFDELLVLMRGRCLAALARQELPFQRLVDRLGLERDPSRTPLLQAALALQNVALPAIDLAGLRFEVMKTQPGTAKFDLSVEVVEEPRGFSGWLEYNCELFEAATGERIGRHFAVLLAGLCDEPRRPVQEVPLLSAAEREQLLRPGSGPSAAPEESLTELLAATVRRQPAAAAASHGNQVLSYAELASRSRRVAAGLRRLGVGAEVLVGVALERAPDLLVAMVGVLSAGGACLLLDPDGERPALVRALERSGIAWLLTRERRLDSLPEHGAEELSLERLETEDGEPDAATAEPDAATAVAANLAFVVQTSGPVGWPRLVGFEHRAVAAWVRHWQRRLGARQLGSVRTTSALETVDAVFDLVVPLCLGGCLVLGSPDEPAGDGATPGASLLSATPSQLAAGLRRGALSGVPDVVRSFGEPLRTPLVRRLHAAGVQQIDDSFSSTLAGVWAWTGGLAAAPAGHDASVPAAWVLDRAGSPAPAGIVGELWLSGAGLARGFYGDARRTAERFVPAACGGCAGARRVRTGDLARRLQDGTVELLGGRERQVELRGRRLDLGRIEAALTSHPDVLQAAVRLQHEQGLARLVAYAVADGAETLAAEVLREHLRTLLPEPEVPAAILVLTELPRTRSGRLDLDALPLAPDDTEHVAPRTELEQLLADKIGELLGIERLGIRDHLFRLGANSLIATQLVARIHEALHLELGAEILFRHPTVADLALAIDELLLAQLDDEALGSLLESGLQGGGESAVIRQTQN
jgi:non-ribosomal peptide synthetase component F/acyl carrier protein